jgi:hypothetical protein
MQADRPITGSYVRWESDQQIDQETRCEQRLQFLCRFPLLL